MRIHELFKEYIWLVNIIKRKGHVSLAEINEEWVETDMSGGLEMARATFHRHRIAIEEMFGLFIECDKSTNEYYIGNAHELDKSSVQNWMLSTLTVSNVLSDSVGLKDRILLERVPAGGELLNDVIEAMKKNRRIQVTYQRYTRDEPKTHILEPYCVKMYNRRWYILGHFPDGYFGMFSLDRIKSFAITEEKFEIPEDFSCEEFFADYFGVAQGFETDVERIVVRAYGSERYNLRDLPIHHTQKVIGEGDNYTDFEIMMKPTLDFHAYVVSRTRMLKVLEPEWLQDEIIELLEETLNHYFEDEE